MRTMALDLGEKTIGVAVSDPLGITAQGVKVLRRGSFKDDLSRLKELVEEYAVGCIVIGYPLNMDGSAGAKAKEIIKFKERLAHALSLPAVLWDERLTTVAAQRTLLQAGMRRADRKKVVDKIAAVLILEGYLQRSHCADERQGDRER